MIHLYIFLIFIIVEFFSFFVVFKIFGKLYLKPDPKTKEKVELKDFAKGMLERALLAFALSNGLPQILIFFGAMKLGTRLKSDIVTDYYNDYFLIGNLYSVFIAILYFLYLNPNSELLNYIINF